MFQALHRFLTGLEPDEHAIDHSDPAFALAVLLIEVARSDDRIDARENSAIARVLARRFGLARDEVSRLIEAAEESAIEATDLFRFTQVVVDKFGEDERIGVIETLWEVAQSDGVVTGDEDTLIRRVAGLIYVTDFERGEAKRRVRERLAGNG